LLEHLRQSYLQARIKPKTLSLTFDEQERRIIL